jgi:hypothetical protein
MRFTGVWCAVSLLFFGVIGAHAQAIGQGGGASFNNGIQGGTPGVPPAGSNVVTVQGVVAGNPVSSASIPYPVGAIVNAPVGTQANAITTTSITGVVGRTSFLCGVQITGLGATGASTVTFTIGGLAGGTFTYYITVPAGVTTPIAPLLLTFNPPLQANATNVNIQLTLGAFGAGNTVQNIQAWGYTL